MCSHYLLSTWNDVLPYFSSDFRVKFGKLESIIDFKRTKQEHFGACLTHMLINNVIYVIFCLCLCVHQSNLNVLAEILLLTYQNVNALANLFANLSYYILSFLNKIAWAKHLGCWLAIFLHSLLINDVFQYKWETFWFISSDKVWKIRKSEER